MILSHESPICMLTQSRAYNDYDYALVHLFEQYKEYMDFFVESLKLGRIVYLDNSIFELGTSFNPERFKEYCNFLGNINPENFYYVVPDALGDSRTTINQFKEFMLQKPKGKSIGVAQGTTFEEFLECYDFMRQEADVVAICFNYKFFGCDAKSWMEGRIRLMDYLYRNSLLDCKIHLLGCSLPQEFMGYKHLNIFSNDTSNPIVHGIHRIKYDRTGLRFKNSQKLVDLIECVPDDEQKECIEHNIRLFKEFTR